jgi:hypothetical protein
MVFLTYVDNCIIISPSHASIDCLATSMQNGPENFKLTDEGDVNKFLGIEITKLDGSTFKLSQPFLIDCILSFLGLCNNEFKTDANSLSNWLQKDFFIGISSENLKNIHGSIKLQSACSHIFKILLTLS